MDVATVDQIVNWIVVITAALGLWLFRFGGWRWLTRSSEIERGPLVPPGRDDTQRVAPVRPLSPRDWLILLNDEPDTHPHLFIAGKSGSGKTTFARAVLQARTGSVCIVDPKNNGADWHPLPYVTYDRDGSLSSIDATLRLLHQELVQRPNNPPDTLTVVLDDVSSIAQSGETKESYLQFVRAAARLGRSKRVRLVMLAHETTATAVGLQGEVALLENMTPVHVLKNHRATLLLDDGGAPLDTRQVPRLAARGLGHLLPWFPPEPVPAPESPPVAGSNPGSGTGSSPVLADIVALEPLIRRMHEEGLSRNQIARIIGGNRQTALTTIRAALDSEPASHD